ncbi:MAG: C-type lectin domain-containing protein [Planctomycetota bacterium]
MYKSIFLTTLICLSSVAAADLSEKWSKRLETADTIYQTAIRKADETRLVAVKKATLDRVRVLKSAIADSTKSGDFTAATELQSRLEAADSEGSVRPKPKNTVKFGGHEYALIEEQANWHVAKRRCEEMGGHLATLETTAESNSLIELLKRTKTIAWIGATDEEEEGVWKWVNGSKVQIEFRHDNANNSEHYMVFWEPSGNWDDNGSYRHSFVCEWDN